MARARRLAALAYLEPVAVGVLELRDVAPRELEHVRDELDPARLQLLGRLAAIVGLDRDRGRGGVRSPARPAPASRATGPAGSRPPSRRRSGTAAHRESGSRR